ncbi:MAG: F0F1 ATP synthase subunit A [Bacillales bacterium]|nr:F0F1 ATP synthase subunit A [Bacillales bacterium]
MLNFSFDWSLPSGAITSIVVVLFLSIFFIAVGASFSKLDPEKDDVPTKGAKFLAVLLVDSINKFVVNNLGEDKLKTYSPYLIGIASFLTLSNLASLFGLNPSVTNMAIALSMSVLAFTMFQYTSFRYQKLKGKIKDLMGPVKAISPIIIPINIIGDIETPFAMGLRLFGNLFSSVLFSAVIFGATEGLGTVVGATISTIITAGILHPIFDIAFGLIQMYVYFMLTTMFIKRNASID